MRDSLQDCLIVLRPKIENYHYYNKKRNILLFHSMNRQHRIFSIDFPLLNIEQYSQLLRVQNRTVQLVKQLMDKKQKKCCHPIPSQKENQIHFKEVEQDLQKFNKRRLYAGSLALHLVDRPPSFKATAIQKITKSRSAYLTTYETYNKQVEMCRGHSLGKRDSPKNCRKNTTVQRIIAPTSAGKVKQRLKLGNRRQQ